MSGAKLFIANRNTRKKNYKKVLTVCSKEWYKWTPHHAYTPSCKVRIEEDLKLYQNLFCAHFRVSMGQFM